MSPTPVAIPVVAPSWQTMPQALRLFIRGVTVRVAGRVAVVVGTILSVVNQGSVIVDGRASTATWIRVGVNYATPFCVASIGFLGACRASHETSCTSGEA